MITQTIYLNMIPGSVCPVIHVSQYDTDENALVFNLYQGSVPFTSGTTATIEGTKQDKTGFTYAASYSDNMVVADLTEQMTAVSGAVMCEIRITDGSNTVGTQNFILMVEPAALANDTVISDTDIPLLQQAIDAAAQVETTTSKFYGTGSKISASANLNDYTTSGKFYAEANQAITNAPISGGFTMFVWYTFNQYRLVQVVFGLDGSISVRALYQNNTWRDWWSSNNCLALTGLTLVSTAVDWNTLNTPGEYYFTKNTYAKGSNAPKGSSTFAGRLTVEYGMSSEQTHIRQTYRPYNSADIFIRVYSGSWTGWKQVSMVDA